MLCCFTEGFIFIAMTYSEKLQDPRWQKRRFDILLRDNWACVRCRNTKITLHVHHKEYVWGRDPWDYEDSNFETVCKVCHKKEHNITDEVEYERKYEHLIPIKNDPEVIKSIDSQILSLMNSLKKNITNKELVEVLKNIMFLKGKKKELID